MKGDFYNSSTHGRIRLSVRGRQLLAAERDAAQGAIYAGDFRDNDAALSKARGDLAYYMGELEQRNAEQRETIQKLTRPKTATEMLAAGYGAGPTRLQQIRAETDRNMEKLRESLVENFLKCPPVYVDFESHTADAMGLLTHGFNPLRYKKETPMTDQKNQEPVEKSRSQLLGEATHELVQAQRELEYVLQDVGKTPAQLYIGGNVVGSFLRGAVAQLVNEQWDALVKKAVARAKARVAKAEKAVAALLA